jgi:hypothetical protein
VDDPWPRVPVRTEATPHDTLVALAADAGAAGDGLCVECHAGVPGEVAASAHAGVVGATARGDGAACLVCHGPAGWSGSASADSLLSAARRVGRPDPANCLACHPVGGPSAARGVHLDRHGLGCTDCHRTAAHRMAGGAPTSDAAPRAACTDCHAPQPHPDSRLNRHTASVACTTCHLPRARVAGRYVWYRADVARAAAIDDPRARIWPVDSTGPLVHDMPPASDAFTCRDCHTKAGVLAWSPLGYPGDPASAGGRALPGASAGER